MKTTFLWLLENLHRAWVLYLTFGDLIFNLIPSHLELKLGDLYLPSHCKTAILLQSISFCLPRCQWYCIYNQYKPNSSYPVQPAYLRFGARMLKGTLSSPSPASATELLWLQKLLEHTNVPSFKHVEYWAGQLDSTIAPWKLEVKPNGQVPTIIPANTSNCNQKMKHRMRVPTIPAKGCYHYWLLGSDMWIIEAKVHRYIITGPSSLIRYVPKL